MISMALTPKPCGAGVVIWLLCWHRRRRLRYISLSNARRMKSHKGYKSAPSLNGSAGAVSFAPSAYQHDSNAFSAMADQPWSSAGSRRQSTPGRHHEVEMNHVVSAHLSFAFPPGCWES